MAWFEGSGTTNRKFLHADERGSVIAASDGTGAAATTVKYSAYGESGALASEFGYTGQLYIPSLELYYYKARMYSPKAGRFMQSDPIGYAGGMNLYAYVSGDPVNATDPWGLEECNVRKGVSQVIVGDQPPGPGKPYTYSDCYAGVELLTFDVPSFPNVNLPNSIFEASQDTSILCAAVVRGALSGAAGGAAYTANVARKEKRIVAGGAVLGALTGAYLATTTDTKVQIAMALTASGTGGVLILEAMRSGRGASWMQGFVGGVGENTNANLEGLDPAKKIVAGAMIGAAAEHLLEGTPRSLVKGARAGAAAQLAAMGMDAGLRARCSAIQ